MKSTVHEFDSTEEQILKTQLEKTECGPFEFSSASQRLIILDLTADLAFFDSPKSFKAAVIKLIEKVMDVSDISIYTN